MCVCRECCVNVHCPSYTHDLSLEVLTQSVRRSTHIARFSSRRDRYGAMEDRSPTTRACAARTSCAIGHHRPCIMDVTTHVRNHLCYQLRSIPVCISSDLQISGGRARRRASECTPSPGRGESHGARARSTAPSRAAVRSLSSQARHGGGPRRRRLLPA